MKKTIIVLIKKDLPPERIAQIKTAFNEAVKKALEKGIVSSFPLFHQD
jgi:hypothetical protein